MFLRERHRGNGVGKHETIDRQGAKLAPGSAEGVAGETGGGGENINRSESRHRSVDGGAESGKLEEVFCSGTAAVVSPVSVLRYQGRDYEIGGGRTGALAQKLYGMLTAIQYGEAEDPHGWREKVA